MKVDRLETHDRWQHFLKQDFDIGANCQRMIDQRPFGPYPFYIFVHKRTIGEDERVSIFNEEFWKQISNPSYTSKYKSLEDVPSHRLIWQPRLTKPKAQPNSMLFKGYPGTNNVKIIWMLPDESTWEAYEKGKLTENKTVVESIVAYKTKRASLEAREEDDFDDEKIDGIYRDLAREAALRKFSTP